MTDSVLKGKILVVTTDEALLRDLSTSAAARDYPVSAAASVPKAAIKLDAEKVSALVADFSRIPSADRQTLLGIHKGRGDFALFVLETLGTLSPAEALALRRVPWPFPQGFADQVRAADKPVVFLADQTLFTSRALPVGLQQAGVQPVVLESTLGLTDLLVKQAEIETRKRETPPPRGFWRRLAGGEVEEGDQSLGNVVVAQFPGTLAEAEAFDARLRKSLPSAVCYYVSSDPARAAVKCLREGLPAVLMREEARRVAGILADSASAQVPSKEKGRILLLDNYKPTLEALAQGLIAAGYDVVTTMDGGEALKLATARGSFHLAVVGTALAYAQHSGAQLAQRLRERDQDLRIIFMVDQYPLQTALKGVSQVVELGLDDALLKPVEASRLIFSVQRALERRFLLLENARLLKEIQESNRQLAQINGFQKKFFAMVAHDVKNPLTAILGYAELLSSRLQGTPELKSAAHIHSAAKTLSLLISDLVDLAAIESGKLRVHIGPLDLAAVIQDVRSRVEVAAQKRRIDFSVEVPPVLPALAGDPARIGQVVQNLCTNALQYTKEGGRMTLRADVTPDWVTVGVADTGIGISREDLPRVFERFFQSQEAQAMRKEGFGLGLKITREIVSMHGGEMGVESEFGKGSRFFFTLPVKKPK